MSSKKDKAARRLARKDVTIKDVTGLKDLRRVAELLGHLHDVGCSRDTAGNRELHFDDYVLLVLLYLMSPMIDSMRSLQKVAALPEVRQRLGIKPFSLGSFSESCRVFEPEMLKEVVEQLYGRMTPVGRQAMFREIPGIIELVDGTLLRTLSTVAEAMLMEGQPGGPGRQHAWKLHLGFEVDRHIPVSLTLTDARGAGESSEKAVLLKRLTKGRTYVMDRYYAQFALFNQIHAKGSNYVCRVRDNSVYDVTSRRTLSTEDLAANVISDEVVALGRASKPSARPDHLIRLVCVKITPHKKRGKTAGGTAGPGSDGILRIATDLLDAPAHVIAFLYEYRWTLEVFIRFFKQLLGCRHLLSTKREGIEIQMYTAVIACILIHLATGRKPNKAMVLLTHFYLIGWATEADVARELTRPDNTGVKLRAKDELWKKLGVK